MKPTRLTTLALASALLLGSCSGEGDIPQGNLPGKCELVVSLSPIKTFSETRSSDDPTWGDGFQPAVGMPDENRIDRLSVHLVTADGTSIPLLPIGFSGVNGEYSYRTVIDLGEDYVNYDEDKKVYSISGKITAVANHPDGDNMANPFSSLPFRMADLTESGAIPMWGVETITNLSLIPNKTVNAGRVALLRSIPKVSIQLDDKIKDTYRIAAVTPSTTDYPSMSYCLPTGAGDVKETAGLSIEGCFNPNTGGAATGAAIFMTDSHADIYMAERECPTDDDGILHFTVTLERKDGASANFDGEVMLCDYDGLKPKPGTAFSRLVRNHEYRYIISLAEMEFKITCEKWIFGGKVHIELDK